MAQEPDPLRRLFGTALDWLWQRSAIGAKALAASAPCDASYLYLVRDGKRLPNPLTVARLDVALNGGGLLVALNQVIEDESRRTRQSRRTVPAEEANVHRRILLQNLAALGAGATATAAGLEAIRGALGSSLTGQEPNDTSVDEWAEIAADYGRTYLVDPPETIIGDLAGDVVDVQQRLELETQPDRKREMSRVSGQLAALMALTLSNLGQRRAARRWWRTARQAADSSGDTATRVWVRSQECVRALYEHRSPQSVIALADEAVAIGGEPYAGKALAAKAQSLALLGRAEEAHAALSAIEPSHWTGTAVALGDHQSIYGWSSVNYLHTASYVWSHTGNVAEADRAQRDVLAQYAQTDQRQRALVLLHQAMCAVRQGDIVDGLAHAQRVIQALPSQQRTATVIEIGHQVVSAVPAIKQGHHDATGELRELLALPAAPEHR